MNFDKAFAALGVATRESYGPQAAAVDAPKAVVETKKQKEARLAAEKEAKKRAKIAAAIAGKKDEPKAEKKKKERANLKKRMNRN